MPEIAPARFVRYSGGPDLSPVVCPPYDVIDEAGRAALEAKSPANYVRLILPREAAGDGPLDRYVRARGLLDQWVASGTMQRDAEPSLFVVEQEFVDSTTGDRRFRRGIQALVKLREFSEGIILPHERTLSGPKADRLELMKAVQAHLSPIFILFPDEQNEVMSAVSALLSTPPTATAEAASAIHRAWRITDPALIATLTKLLAPRKGYIADGHHRYETALHFRALAKQAGKTVEGTPLDYIPAFLCGMSDPGLVIFPTHRLAHSMTIDPKTLLPALQTFFDSEVIASGKGQLPAPDELRGALKKLAESGRQALSFLLYSHGVMPTMLLSLKKDAPLDTVKTLSTVKALRSLDVTILHSIVMEHILGMSRESQEKQLNLKYEKDAGKALARVESGEAQLAFLLNPTKMEQVRDVAEAGEVMPQKSTYFFPKIIDGLGLQLLNEGSL
jgi:uncharacterized protein (DUF1015 family)